MARFPADATLLPGASLGPRGDQTTRLAETSLDDDSAWFAQAGVAIQTSINLRFFNLPYWEPIRSWNVANERRILLKRELHRRRRNILRGLVRAVVILRRMRVRAAQTAYAPDGIGFAVAAESFRRAQESQTKRKSGGGGGGGDDDDDGEMTAKRVRGF